jgi:polysaccharide transporter, PST family
MPARRAGVRAAFSFMAFQQVLQRLFLSRLLRTTLALYVVQAARYVAPLIILPWLARVLRADALGVLIAVQSFGAWSALLIDYGFYYGGARQAAVLRDDPAAMRQLAASLLGAKLGLTALSFLIAGASALAIPMFQDHPLELGLAWTTSVLMGFTPFWYFQGTERMGVVTAVDAIAQLLAAFAIVLFVRAPDDAVLALGIFTMAALTSTGLLTIRMYREVGFSWPAWAASHALLASNTSLFVFRGASGLITAGNGFMLSFFVPPAMVGHYGAAERLIRAGTSLLGPMSQAFYPRITRVLTTDRARAATLARFAVLVLLGIAAAAWVVLVVYAHRLAPILFGADFVAAAPYIRILALLMPLVAIGTGVGVLWALPLGWDRAVASLVTAAGVANVVLALVIVPAFGARGMAWTVVTAEAIMPLGIVFLLSRSGVGFWQRSPPQPPAPRPPAPQSANPAGEGGI